MEITEKKEALSCFEGGRQGVIQDIRLKVKERLSDVPDEHIERLGRGIGIKHEILMSIKKDPPNGQLTLGLFQKLKMPLGFSFHQVLGRPTNLDDPEIGNYWRKESEHQNSPIFFAARCADATGGKNEELSPEKKEKLALEVYVTLRAIEELSGGDW